MKLFAIAGLIAMAASASANAFYGSFPDLEMGRNYEKSVIAADATVKAYAKALGATAFKVNNGPKEALVYGVATNNGCVFNVEVVYNSWPGVDGVIVYKNAICR